MKKLLMGLSVMLTLVGCSSLGTKNEKIMGKEYVLQGEAASYNLTLNFAEENFFGYSGVNRYFGTYEKTAEGIKFKNIGRTMMMGPNEVMDIEDAYIDDLEAANTYMVQGEKLIIKTNQGKELIFQEKVKPELKK